MAGDAVPLFKDMMYHENQFFSHISSGFDFSRKKKSKLNSVEHKIIYKMSESMHTIV